MTTSIDFHKRISKLNSKQKTEYTGGSSEGQMVDGASEPPVGVKVPLRLDSEHFEEHFQRSFFKGHFYS